MTIPQSIKQDVRGAIKLLERYKRYIGRVYNAHRHKELAELYNQLEDEIATLSARYNVKRKSKPYKITSQGV